MRLNVCCGKRYRDGWTNVDIVASPDGPPPDILAHAQSIPLPDGCAEELMCIHGWEHFYRWEVEAVITEWKRLLAPNGLLVLELPDLIKCCENILSGYNRNGIGHPDQYGMWGLYGDPRLGDPYMNHRWGWTPKTLRVFLKGQGFVEIIDAETQWHPAGRMRRDMRIEARKP